MAFKRPEFLRYYIRVANVQVFNAMVSSAEQYDTRDLEARREGGYYILRTNNEYVWRELFLYGQMLAQAQGEHIEAGEG